MPNLNFSCKESASNWIDFGSQMRGLNSETISNCGSILGDFCELLQRSSLPKSTYQKIFGPSSGATITFITSQRRGSKPPNLAIFFAFLKTSGCDLTTFRTRKVLGTFEKQAPCLRFCPQENWSRDCVHFTLFKRIRLSSATTSSTLTKLKNRCVHDMEITL